MKKTVIATAVALCMGTSLSHAVNMNSATFIMYDPNGILVSNTCGGSGNCPNGVDPTLVGTIGNGVFGVSSTETFFGYNWFAKSGTTFGPGTYTFDVMAGETPFPLYTGIVVGPNQVGGHILFDWGASNSTTSCGLAACNIDVVNVWNLSTSGGITTYTSTDVTANKKTGGGVVTVLGPDGTPGLPMIDGAFIGFSANFEFKIPAAPKANPDSRSTTVNTPVTINLINNDSAAATTAVPPDTASVSPAAVPPAVINLPASPLPSGATLSNNGDGSVVYTPPADVEIVDSFQYTLTDDAGRQSAPATVTVTVSATANTPPTANNVVFTTAEDTALQIAVNDTDNNGAPVATDPDNDSLKYDTFDVLSLQDGAVTVDPATNTILTYTPHANFNGQDSFSFSVTDNIDNSNTASITVNVTPVNDAPVCTDVSFSAAKDAPKTINVKDDLLSTCTDPDVGDVISLDSTTQPTVSGSMLTFDGNNTLTYTPANGFEGQDTFTYTVTDGNAFDTRTVFVNVSGAIFGNFTMLDPRAANAPATPPSIDSTRASRRPPSS